MTFDCYGTLVDFATPGFLSALDEICRRQGLPIDGQTLLDKWLEAAKAIAQEDAARAGRPLVEADWPEAAEMVFRPYRERWPAEFNRALRALGLTGDGQAASDLLRQRLAEATAYADTHAVLAALKDGGSYRLALLSNADDDFLRPCLARNRLDAFEVVLSSEDARSYKPNRTIFQRLAQVLGLEPAAIVYVGDSPRTDIVGARRAGLRAVWVNRYGQTWPEGVPPPELQVHDLDELLKLLVGD